MVKKFKKTLKEIYMEVNNMVWIYQHKKMTLYYRELIISDILEVTEELVSNLCKKIVRKYTITEFTNEELFVIATGEVLFYALKNYKKSKNDNFMLFWKLCIERKFMNELKRLSTQKRKYERTHICSLDNEIDSLGNTILTYRGVKDFSEEICSKIILANLIEEFEENDKYGKIIRMVTIQNKEIRKQAFIQVLGCEEYKEKERKKVQRTKERFRKLLINKGITSVDAM